MNRECIACHSSHRPIHCAGLCTLCYHYAAEYLRQPSAADQQVVRNRVRKVITECEFDVATGALFALRQQRSTERNGGWNTAKYVYDDGEYVPR